MKIFVILRTLLIIAMSLCLLSIPASANERTFEEKPWGLGMIMRKATIPFATDEGHVTSLVPMMWYQGEHAFILGMEGGVSFFEKDRWRFSALGRMHFFDIPSDFQNDYQGDTVDAGFQARYQVFGPTYFDFELMTDFEGNGLANIRYGSSWQNKKFQFHPYLELKLKNRQYNSYYFGLDRQKVVGGGDFAVGFFGTYHFVSNFYAYGAAKFTLLDRHVRDSSFVNKDGLSEVYLGFGLSNNRKADLKPVVVNTGYWRIAHGWATPSSLAHIIRGTADKDEYNNQLTSVFYGHPLTDTVFGLPLRTFINAGFVWHHASSVQDHTQEYVVNIKLYYTVPLPVRLRLGAAEGLSYVTDIPYVEKTQLGKKGYNPSNLLNFLDLSLDLNIGDITGGKTMKHWWLGYSIHHRSAIFESAQHFGRIKGGSNFQSVYLQWHY